VRITPVVVNRARQHVMLRDAWARIRLRAWLAPAKRALVPVAAPPQRQLRSRRSDGVTVCTTAVADMTRAAGYVRQVLRDGGGEQPRTLQRLDAQLAHVLAAEAQVAEDCLRDVSDDDAIGAVVATVEASQRLLAAWRAQVAAAPRETARRRRHREARAARLAAERAAVPALTPAARTMAKAAAAARRVAEQRAARQLAMEVARRVLAAAAAAGVRPVQRRGGTRRAAPDTGAATRAVCARVGGATCAVAQVAAAPVVPHGGSGGVLTAATVAVHGAVVRHGCVRPREARDDDAEAGHGRARARVGATAVGRGHVRPRDDDDGDAGAVRVRQRVCVMAVEVVRVQKRVRDGDDDEASRGRVVRVRRGAEAGGASTPHQDGGGGILSGSGAV
jgi:hypothetical protein